MISRPGPLSLDTLSRPRGGHRRFVTSALRAPFTHGLSHRRVPRAPASHHGSLWPNASRCQECALAKSENRVRPQICRRDCVTIEANTGNCLSSAGLWILQRAPLKITPSMPALTPSFSRLARYWSSSAAPSSGSSAFQPGSGGTIEARSRDHPKVVVINFVQPHRPARAVNARRAGD